MPKGQMEITFKGTLPEVMQQVWEFAWSVGISEPIKKAEIDPEVKEHLANTVGQKKPFKDLMADFERGLILREMDNCDDNISKAARVLGLSRVTVMTKLGQYGY